MANPYVAAIGIALDVGQKLIDGRSEEAFDSLNPFAKSGGGPIAVEFSGDGQQKVEHKLGKAPDMGWYIVGASGKGNFWNYAEPDDKFLYIELVGSGGAVTLKLVVA